MKLAAVGLQARKAPILKKLKQLIADGKIGKVLSSTWYGNANNGGEQELVESMCRREVGGNLLTIHMGHALDYVQFGTLTLFFMSSWSFILVMRFSGVCALQYHKRF